MSICHLSYKLYTWEINQFQGKYVYKTKSYNPIIFGPIDYRASSAVRKKNCLVLAVDFHPEGIVRRKQVVLIPCQAPNNTAGGYRLS